MLSQYLSSMMWALVWLQNPAEQPDTRDWHARRELPPVPEGQKQPARQSNDPVQRTEPLPARREGSQQDLRPREAPQQASERPATSNGPPAAPAAPSAVRCFTQPPCLWCDLTLDPPTTCPSKHHV